VKVDLSRESEVLRSVVRIYAAFGCECRVFQEGRRTRITPGWPDLAVFAPAKGRMWLHEVKTADGVQSPEQSAMELLAKRCNVDYVLGGVHDAQEQLRKVGLIADALHESFR